MENKLKLFIDNTIQNSFWDWDVRYEEVKDYRTIEDDWFLHFTDWHIRVVYYFGQDRKINRKDRTWFDKQSKNIVDSVKHEFMKTLISDNDLQELIENKMI